MRDHLDAFARYLAAANHAPRTVKTYRTVISSFDSFLSTSAGPPTRAQIEVFLARPRRDGARRAASARNQEFAAIRAFVTFALRELNWQSNPAEGIAFVREAPRDPAVLNAGELADLFETAARVSRARDRSRNLAILAVLSQAGLRVHEAVSLDLHQVDLASGTLLAVHGKGGTVHDLPLNAPARALLGAWMAERKAAQGESALFVSQRRTRLSIRSVEWLLQHLRSGMGAGKRITPHTLRHTAATLTLTAGTDLATVAELLRHSDLNTTRRYLHLVDTRRREAVRRLEGTVPRSILPGSGGPNPPLAKATLPIPLEPRGSPRQFGLDDQCGLAAA